MAAVEEPIKAAGDVVWDEFTLVNFAGKRLNIIAMTGEVNLFEDIFSNAVYGNAVIIDTQNLLHVFPIIGQEKLFIKFHTPKMADQHTVERVFRVVKVNNHSIDRGKRGYMIHFISYDAYCDLRYTENSVLKGTADQIIKTAIGKMRQWSQLPADVTAKLKPLTNFTPTSNQLKIISPQWSTFECISYAVRNSIGTNGTNDFMFYDTLKGYQFKQLKDLFAQTPVDSFVHDQLSPGTNIAHQYKKIKNLSYPLVVDNINQALNHGFGHAVYSHNLLNKQLTVTKFDKKELNNFSINGKPIIASSDNEMIFANDHNSVIANVYPYRHDEIKVDKVDEVIRTRLPMLNKLEKFKLDVEVWGRTWLKAGDLIDLTIGKYTSKVGEDAVDRYSSGKYLITAIHHRLSVSQHTISMQIVKDSNAIDWVSI